MPTDPAVDPGAIEDRSVDSTDGDAEPADPSDIRRYLSPPVMAFESRQKRQHEM